MCDLDNPSRRNIICRDSGYFADQLSEAQEIRGNLTIKVKNESRGFHLNNLSYAGPIVMGVGGFIVVAACVMTFEARDNAAKVGPARLRQNQTASLKQAKDNRSRRSIHCQQTSKWDQQPGLFRTNRSPSPSPHDAARMQTTAGFIQFSKGLNEKEGSHLIKKSPSAPTLAEKKSPKPRSPKFAGSALLNKPDLLQRHAVSVDNPGYNPDHQTIKENLDQQKMNGSQVSMAMDLHIPNKGPVTLKIKDRSNTGRRNQLARQEKVEDLEEVSEAKKIAGNQSGSPQLPSVYCRFPEDFLPAKRNSIDLKMIEELNLKDSLKASPQYFRKCSSPNFRMMSFDRIGSDRRSEKSLGSRKASLDFKRSPDFRKYDYRKYSIERFTADCAMYLEEEAENRAKAASGENLRRQKLSKLCHSKSDDRRRSFDRFRRESESISRYSLNSSAAAESCPPEYEIKYFTAISLEAEDSKADLSDTSRIMDCCDDQEGSHLSPEANDALLEEPELENLTEVEVEEFLKIQDQILGHAEGGVARHVVVMKDPVTSDVCAHLVNSFFQTFEYLAIVDLIYGLSRWNKLFVDDYLAIKKGNDHRFHLRLAHASFHAFTSLLKLFPPSKYLGTTKSTITMHFYNFSVRFRSCFTQSGANFISTRCSRYRFSIFVTSTTNTRLLSTTQQANQARSTQ
ncbi:uncharacterized protein LOC117170064 [Belonocnema kinseyi]|uniref:uncharacterized protein LOC117170064 n=1 Tax=Belonocnema kinseyi TaxID=2817044 RepID=UPI00143E0B2C|nr:uncharacterized protein LOC117170064 [Belonocnema kinseyi]